jgi:hypothetical protein
MVAAHPDVTGKQSEVPHRSREAGDPRTVPALTPEPTMASGGIEMIGVGWPMEVPPPGGAGETTLIGGIIGLLLLLAFSGLVIWRDRRSVHKAQPDLHIEHPAEFRKAAA